MTNVVIVYGCTECGCTGVLELNNLATGEMLAQEMETAHKVFYNGANPCHIENKLKFIQLEFVSDRSDESAVHWARIKVAVRRNYGSISFA